MELDLGDRLQGTTVISIVSILTPVGRIPQRYDRGSGLAIPWKDVERPTFDLGDLMLGM